ncbi:proton-coupled folate transporter-like isoform X2 [Phymastichus coffea]|uniref:proton-coupled folate transporter-like isoform X2 n=1 Tax=Phymastichus coffea TaxID=108790 RepID=UPI00273B69A3|nr:proton-coupled folate transporter-like isoform X2 [Phymastichus coffea]
MENLEVSVWKRITFIDPVTFFIMFAFTLSDSVINDVIVLKKCQRIIENDSECSVLHENSSSESAKSLQEIVQPQIATFLVLKSLIETFFPMIIILFTGPWSDANGRKPILTIPFVGSIIYYTLYAVLSYTNLDIYWFLLPSLISSVMGGFPTILMISFCYIADITDSNNRAARLGVLDFVIFGGQLVGYLVNPILYKSFGYCVVFATSAFVCLLGLVYEYFFLMETIYVNIGRSLRDVFDPTVLRKLFAFVSKRRDGFDRVLFWCCLCIIAIHDDNMQGAATILYLYTKRFGWNLQDFSTYAMTQLIVTMTGMLLLIKWIMTMFQLPETVGIAIASISNCSGALMKAFAKEWQHLYLSTMIGAFCLAPASLVRSIISKTVSERQIGKAFAVTTAMEKIGPLAATPLFVVLHTKYIKSYPCIVWFLPAALSLLIVVLAIVVERRWRRLSTSDRRAMDE